MEITNNDNSYATKLADFVYGSIIQHKEDSNSFGLTLFLDKRYMSETVISTDNIQYLLNAIVSSLQEYYNMNVEITPIELFSNRLSVFIRIIDIGLLKWG